MGPLERNALPASLRGTFIALASLATLLLAQTSTAQQTINNAGCMQDAAGFNLNCTANDVRIARAFNPVIVDGCAFPGDLATFTATFEVSTTATERYDIGLYFATDGDPNNNGAVSGTCSVSTLPSSPSPFLNLDAAPDTCGDIKRPGNNPLYPVITLTNVVCEDTDGDGFLNLPNCTSWRQSGANDLCNDPLDAFPGAPSKCRCDATFNVPVPVPPASLQVTKTAVPESRPEPGGSFRFDVSVKNTGVDPNNPVTLQTLSDNKHGNITTTGHGGITSTTCTVGGQIASGATYTCNFVATIAGNAGFAETDIVTANAIDSHGNSVGGHDDATISLTDVLPAITVAKSATPTQLAEPGGNVTFRVVVTNTSPATSDDVTITSLTDSVYGNLSGKGTCPALPTTIAKGQKIDCTFVGSVTGNSGDSETDTVTASGADDEGNPVSGFASATVTITNTPSQIEVTKTASPTTLNEPGGSVTYTVVVKNNSAVDSVTISSLSDDKFGNLSGVGTCTVPFTLVPGASRSCQFSRTVSGNANTSHVNVATASGLDDDGQAVTDDDDATVTFANVAPDASLTKSVTKVIATFTVVVKNESTAEALTLNALTDDKFGGITTVHGNVKSTTCQVPRLLQPKGQQGDTYQCSFDGEVTTSPHTDTVTGTVVDDDNSTADQPSDSATVTFE